MGSALHPDWPEADEQQLRALHPQYSARVIGEKLGYSKNAVLGKLHRLGLGVKQQNKKPTEKNQPEKQETFLAIKPSSEKPATVPVFKLVPEPEPRRFSILDLKDSGECKWPIDYHGKMAFCGAPTRIKLDYRGRIVPQSYCPLHAKRSYLTPR